MKKILLLIIGSVFIISSCVDDHEEPQIQATTLYWRANFDGTNLDLTQGQHSYVCKDFLDSSKFFGAYTRPWTMIANPSDFSGQDYVSVSFEAKSFSGFPSYSEFKSFFTPGTYTYANIPGHTQQNGVRIEYFEAATNTMWYTYLDSQSGSTFSVTDVVYSQIDDGYSATVTANFSCTLYDGNGNSKPLTNGKYVLMFFCFP